MKNIKRFSLFSLITIILLFLNSVIVSAALLDPVAHKLRYIFFNLSGSAAFAVWLKFAFFVIIFAVLFGAGTRLRQFSEGPMKRALTVVAFVIALTTAIFVPYKLLLYIFKMYHAILVVLFGILPALIGYFIAQSIPVEGRWGRVVRGFIYILITVFIFGLIGQIQATSSPETKLYMQILEPLEIGAIIAFILGIFNLLMAIGGDKVAGAIPSWLGGSRGAGAPAGAPGQQPQQQQQAPQPDQQQINQLHQAMATFANLVNQAPNNIVQRVQTVALQYEQNIRQVPVQQLRANPQARQLVQQLMHDLTDMQQDITNARTLMQQIFQNQQYLNTINPMRQMFENAVADFLMAEAMRTQLYNILQGI